MESSNTFRVNYMSYVFIKEQILKEETIKYRHVTLLLAGYIIQFVQFSYWKLPFRPSVFITLELCHIFFYEVWHAIECTHALLCSCIFSLKLGASALNCSSTVIMYISYIKNIFLNLKPYSLTYLHHRKAGFCLTASAVIKSIWHK